MKARTFFLWKNC